MDLRGELCEMDWRKELAAAADDDQRGGKLGIGRERETSIEIGARGGALIDDRDLCAGDRLPFRTDQTRLECAGLFTAEDEERQRGKATDAAADATEDRLSVSRGMTSVSIALRMCFAMRLM